MTILAGGDLNLRDKEVRITLCPSIYGICQAHPLYFLRFSLLALEGFLLAFAMPGSLLVVERRLNLPGIWCAMTICPTMCPVPKATLSLEWGSIACLFVKHFLSKLSSSTLVSSVLNVFYQMSAFPVTTGASSLHTRFSVNSCLLYSSLSYRLWCSHALVVFIACTLLTTSVNKAILLSPWYRIRKLADLLRDCTNLVGRSLSPSIIRPWFTRQFNLL